MCHSWNWQETRVVFRSRGLDSTTVLYCRERPTVSSLPNLSLDSKKAASTSPKRARSPLSLSMAHASVRGGIFSKCTRPRTSTDGTCRCAMLYVGSLHVQRAWEGSSIIISLSLCLSPASMMILCRRPSHL
jgi:hypothetical protein